MHVLEALNYSDPNSESENILLIVALLTNERIANDFIPVHDTA